MKIEWKNCSQKVTTSYNIYFSICLYEMRYVIICAVAICYLRVSHFPHFSGSYATWRRERYMFVNLGRKRHFFGYKNENKWRYFKSLNKTKVWNRIPKEFWILSTDFHFSNNSNSSAKRILSISSSRFGWAAASKEKKTKKCEDYAKKIVSHRTQFSFIESEKSKRGKRMFGIYFIFLPFTPLQLPRPLSIPTSKDKQSAKHFSQKKIQSGWKNPSRNTLLSDHIYSKSAMQWM